MKPGRLHAIWKRTTSTALLWVPATTLCAVLSTYLTGFVVPSGLHFATTDVLALPFALAAIATTTLSTRRWKPSSRAASCSLVALALIFGRLTNAVWLTGGLCAVLLVLCVLGENLPTRVSRRPNSHINASGKPKRPYATLSAAEQVANRRSAEAGELFSAYQCASCEYFHIGHSSKRR